MWLSSCLLLEYGCEQGFKIGTEAGQHSVYSLLSKERSSDAPSHGW